MLMGRGRSGFLGGTRACAASEALMALKGAAFLTPRVPMTLRVRIGVHAEEAVDDFELG